jgi:HK97 gp10 family phage protein
MESKWNDKEVLENIRGKILDALEVSGALVEGSAKDIVPVDTGNLKGSIVHKVNESDLSVTIGTNVEYAPYIEFGTGEFAEGGKGRKGGWVYIDEKGNKHFTLGNKPQPFLRPALLENKENILKIFKDALK